MRILMVSTFPPMKCGIGTYAMQQVAKLRMEGHIVDVLTPYEGKGDFTDSFSSIGFPVRTMLKGIFYDKVIIQYHEAFYYAEFPSLTRFVTHLSFTILFGMLKYTEVVVHEIKFAKFRGRRRLSGMYDRVEHFFDYLKWRTCPEVTFHSRNEIDQFTKATGITKNFKLTKPHEHFIKYTAFSKEEARTYLDINQNTINLLCIGFIQPHKGFDRVIRALKKVDCDQINLHIVGSLRLVYDETIAYLNKLKQLAQEDHRVTLVEKFVGDEEFDIWIQSSDIVVIPYNEIWTSGVIGRAKLYNKTVWAASVGSLSEQLEDHDVLFDDDTKLTALIEAIAGRLSPKILSQTILL